MSVSNSVSDDDAYFNDKSSSNRLRHVATGVCITSSKQSGPVYSKIKRFGSKNGNTTFVDAKITRMCTGSSTSTHSCTIDSSEESASERDKERHAEFPRKESTGGMCYPRNKAEKQSYCAFERPRSSTPSSDALSNISWSTPKFASKRSTSSHSCSMNSSEESATELDEKRHTEFPTKESTGEKCFPRNESEKQTYCVFERPCSSTPSSDALSNISWSTPKFASTPVQTLNDFSRDEIESGTSSSEDQVEIGIHDTPKRIHLKSMHTGRKIRRKPIRLANLPRKIYTRNKDEIRVRQEDIKIVELSSDSEGLDVNKFLAKTRRRLTFPPEEELDKDIASHFTSISEKVDSFIMSDISEASDLNELMVIADDGELREESKVLEESEDKVFFNNYIAKLKKVAAKPPTTKRAKAFEQRKTPKTDFDFNDYCAKIFSLKEKINSERK